MVKWYNTWQSIGCRLLITVIKYPCIYFKASVRKNQTYIICVTCNQWAHVTCGNIDDAIIHPNEDWVCNVCYINELPFSGVEQGETPFESSDISFNCSKNNSVLYDEFPILNGLTVVQLNIRSVRKKKDELFLFLESNPYDILAITEIWLDKDYLSGLISHDEYYFESRDRPDQSGGGIGCYLKKTLSYTLSVIKLEYFFQFESFQINHCHFNTYIVLNDVIWSQC